MVLPGAGSITMGPRLVIALIALLGAGAAMVVNRGSKSIALVFGIAMAIVATLVYLPFGFEFFPQTDQSQLTITVRTPSGTSLAATDKVVQKIEEVVGRLPEMKTVRYRVSDGGGGTRSVGPNTTTRSKPATAWPCPARALRE